MSGGYSRRGEDDSEYNCIPKMNTIFQGEVAAIKDYGAFIKIPGCYKNGLVHKTQMAQCRVDHVNDIVNIRDKVWCKVISVGGDGNKIALSMKVVHQGNGRDLDPNGVQIGLDENRRRNFVPSTERRINLDAVYNTTCRRCGTRGHLAQDCFVVPGGRSYDILSDEDGGMMELRPEPYPRLEREHRVKKSKKRKRHHDDSSASDDSSNLSSGSASSSSDKRMPKHRHHHRRHHHHRHRHQKKLRVEGEPLPPAPPQWDGGYATPSPPPQSSRGTIRRSHHK